MINYFIKYASYPLIARRDGFQAILTHTSNLRKNEFLSAEKIKKIQFNKIKKLLNHAYRNTKFYKERFEAVGFSPQTVKDFVDLEKIPVLTKNDILKNREKMKTSNIDPSMIHESASGGTTGNLTPFYRDDASLVFKEAGIHRFESWAGWQPGEWMSIIWPATIDFENTKKFRSHIKNVLSYRKITLPFVTRDEKQIEDHIRQMINKKVKIIRAFPTPLLEVARYVLDNKISGFSVKGIVTTGEILYAHQREFIERAFNSPVFDSYRTREIGPIAQECEYHQGMHINMDQVYVEVVQPEVEKKEKISNNGKYGRILITDLLNYGMPFIRYEIGDYAAIKDTSCPCGRGLTMLEGLGGRIADILYTVHGQIITPITLLPSLFERFKIRNQLQVIQDAFDHIIIRLSLPKLAEDIIDKQIEIARQIFGQELKIDYEYVEEIPRKRSGKYPIIICTIPREQINSTN
jgi:phenylacetate-CoA ligase